VGRTFPKIIKKPVGWKKREKGRRKGKTFWVIHRFEGRGFFSYSHKYKSPEIKSQKKSFDEVGEGPPRAGQREGDHQWALFLYEIKGYSLGKGGKTWGDVL